MKFLSFLFLIFLISTAGCKTIDAMDSAMADITTSVGKTTSEDVVPQTGRALGDRAERELSRDQKNDSGNKKTKKSNQSGDSNSSSANSGGGDEGDVIVADEGDGGQAENTALSKSVSSRSRDRRSSDIILINKKMEGRLEISNHYVVTAARMAAAKSKNITCYSRDRKNRCVAKPISKKQIQLTFFSNGKKCGQKVCSTGSL